MPIRNLVFEGGGVLGVAYGGVLQVLHDENVLGEIERVAGTSVGSIAALAVSLRYPAPEIRRLLFELDFKRFISQSEPFEFTKRYGWYKMEPLLEWLQELIAGAGEYLWPREQLTGEETFEDLREAGGRDLNVFATDLNTRRSTRFSAERTPRVPVAHAVAASCSIPGFFQAVKFPGGIPNGHIFVDGGLLLNFPITAFDTARGANHETIGFKFTFAGSAPRRDLDFGMVGTWAEQVYETIKDGQSERMRTTPEHYHRTGFIPTGGISVVDFDLTDEEKQLLFENGRRTADRFIYRHRSRSSIFRQVLDWLAPPRQ